VVLRIHAHLLYGVFTVWHYTLSQYGGICTRLHFERRLLKISRLLRLRLLLDVLGGQDILTDLLDEPNLNSGVSDALKTGYRLST